MLDCGNREHRYGSMRAGNPQRNGEAMPEEAERVYTYCVYCQTQKCSHAAIQIQQIFHCRVIQPKREQLKWVKGKPIRETHDLLPGYLFLYADQEIEQPQTLREIMGVVRCLSDQEHRYILQGNDRTFALMLLENGGMIGKMKVYREGDKIRLCDGIYTGVETEIVKVNRRNLRMLVRIPFAGMQVETWVEYEMVKPIEE